MKLTVSLFIFIFSNLANADSIIEDSEYELRHQVFIQKSVERACNISGQLIQLNSQVESIDIDNGIQDLIYTSNLQMKTGVDQGGFDLYEIEIITIRYDNYDHEHQDWGSYDLVAISCQLN